MMIYQPEAMGPMTRGIGQGIDGPHHMRETLGKPLYHVALNKGSMNKNTSPLRSSHSPSRRFQVAPFENSFVRTRRNEG